MKGAFISAFDERIGHLSAKLTAITSKNTYKYIHENKDGMINEELKMLQKKFFVPIIRLVVMLFLSDKGTLLKY